MPEAIKEFSGEYRFLSNFHPCIIEWQGGTYPTLEHAYQASKTFVLKERQMICTSQSPARAKRLGRKVKLRSDWESVKDSIMRALLRTKFRLGSELAKQLLGTGDATLIEGNWWGDTYWGVYEGRGQNHLGKLLMQVRSELAVSSYSHDEEV